MMHGQKNINFGIRRPRM